MNNEPVAYVDPIWMDRPDLVMSHQLEIGKLFARTQFTNYVPLYTHPANPYKSITNTKIEPTVVSYTHPVKELTPQEVNDCWSESQEDSIGMKLSFTTGHHYFAYLLLKKARE